MKIKSCIVRDVCYRKNNAKNFTPYPEWRFIESKITGNDSEDGGASYEAIFQEVSTKNFYRAEYTDWDFYWEYSAWKEDKTDGPSKGRTIEDNEIMDIYPVKAKTITTVIYE